MRRKKHITNDFNVSCLHKNFITQKKIETLLSKINIKYNEVDFVYFYEVEKTLKYIKEIDDDNQRFFSKN